MTATPREIAQAALDAAPSTSSAGDPDAWRRVGWAKWYAARRDLAELQGLLVGLISEILRAHTQHPQTTAAGELADRAYREHIRPLLALIGDMRTWSQEQAEAYFDGLDAGQSIGTSVVYAEPLTGALRSHVYLQGVRHARTSDHYPTYLAQQLSAVVDGPEVWTGAHTSRPPPQRHPIVRQF